jgi:Ca2+-binding EF-hand superfamily protein
LFRIIFKKEQIMAHKMKPAEIREFRAAFDHFDKNGDGTINVQELKEVMKSMGKNPTVEELRDMINNVDLDGNEVVDFFEFLQMMGDKNVS